MNILDEEGIAFFKRELLAETERQLRLFESQTNPLQEEFGRIKLYDDRTKITRHFTICTPDIGAFLSNHPSHGLLGKLHEDVTTASLVWKEQEGLRHSLMETLHPDLPWNKNGEPPKARLTESGKITKKLSSL